MPKQIAKVIDGFALVGELNRGGYILNGSGTTGDHFRNLDAPPSGSRRAIQHIAQGASVLPVGVVRIQDTLCFSLIHLNSDAGKQKKPRSFQGENPMKKAGR
jgi:hypothetical protein